MQDKIKFISESRRPLSGLTFFTIVVSLLVTALYGCSPAVPAASGSPRCAIVDQLADKYPNPDFIAANTAVLEAAGFTVDVFSGDAVTVDFWRDLPARGYRLIILRVHAAVKEPSGEVSRVWMFSNEPYSRWRYVMSQLRDQVTRAKTREEGAREVFAVNDRFITGCMHGDFGGAVIINMGCAAFVNDDIARAFVDRGAATYIGWNASVGVGYVDSAAGTLLGNLYGRGLTLKDAVAATMLENGPDPDYGAILSYYPAGSAGRTFKPAVP